MKSYTFKVVLERDKWPDEPDSEAVWVASVPSLIEKGASTYGSSEQEALGNLQEVLQMIIEGMNDRGEPVPEILTSSAEISEEPRIVVNV